MFIIDNIACNSSLRETHPVEKLVLSGMTMLCALVSTKLLVPLSLFIIISSVIIFKAGVSPFDYLRLLLIPCFFIAVSVLAVVLVYNPDLTDSVLIISLKGMTIGFTQKSLESGVKIFMRSLSSISCFYFFILTTPMSDIEYILIKMRLPVFFREIFILVYRHIFILIDISRRIFISQKSRMGYTGLGRSYRSMGRLVSSLFIRSLTYGQESYQALVSRGYCGELGVLRRGYKTSVANWNLIALILIFSISMEIGLR